MKISSKQEIEELNFYLSLGSISHIATLSIIFFGCWVSEFTCTGDDMGGVMMVYALSIAMPQILMEFIIFSKVIINAYTKKLFKAKSNLLVYYFLSLILVIISNFII